MSTWNRKRKKNMGSEKSIETRIKPNFFIVGMPRSGTTSLYAYLKQHPDIYVSLFKEPHFFGTDLTQPRINVTDEELYYGLFAGAGQRKRVGEASVWYLTSATAAGEIKAFNPGAKIIVMLRNPVDMIQSLHSLYMRTGNENVADIEAALALQPGRMQGKKIPPGCYFPEGLFYTEVAIYFDKSKRFVDRFGLDNIQFVIFDEFASDTPSAYKAVLAFLEVEPSFQAHFGDDEAKEAVRPMVLQQVRQAHPEIKKRLQRKQGKTHIGKRYAAFAPEARKRLMEQFKIDIEKTGALIKRDLSGWF
ncbi:MAG: sulfotransferase [bacterium]|nr:sulfotransferase [bacterium]